MPMEAMAYWVESPAPMTDFILAEEEEIQYVH